MHRMPPRFPVGTEAEIQELKPHSPDWTLVERETIQRLEVFRLRTFAEALSFTNRAGALSEAEIDSLAPPR